MNGLATGDVQDRILKLTQDLIGLRMTTRDRCFAGRELIRAVLSHSGIGVSYKSFGGGRAPHSWVLEAAVGPRVARHTICLYGHLDGRDVEQAKWESLWPPRIKDHWLVGTGGLARLGAIACMVEALIVMAADPRNVRVILLLVDDGEQPPPHVLADWRAAEGEGVDLMIAGEPTQLKIGHPEPIPAGWIWPDDRVVRTLVEAVRPAHPSGTDLVVAHSAGGGGGYTWRGAGDSVRTVTCGLISEEHDGLEHLDIGSVLTYTGILTRYHQLLADSTT